MNRAERLAVAAVAVLIAAAAWLAFDGAAKKGAYYDEPKHVATGLAWHLHGRFVGDDNTPFVALHALPLRFALDGDLARELLPARFEPGGVLFRAGAALLERSGVANVLLPARCVSVALFALLLALVAIAGWRAGGPAGALLATALLGFDPTFLAHGGLVSADLPVCAMALLSILAYRAVLARPSPARALLLAFAFALVLLAKLTGAFVVLALGIDLALRARQPLFARRAAACACALLAAFCLVALAYRGDPWSWFRSLELVSGYGARRSTAYFHGTLGARSPWFYPAVFLMKAKPALLAFTAVALLAMARLRRRAAGTAPPDRVTLLPLALLFVAPIASGYQQGIRFLLPALALLPVALASLGGLAPSLARTWRGKFVLGAAAALLGLHVAGTLAQHPHHLAYFNALAGGPDRGHRWFVDSNSDWGQDTPLLREFVEAHGVDQLYLASYGSVPPTAYGLAAIDLYGPAAFVDPAPGAKALVAVHDTLLFSITAQGGPANDPLRPLLDVLVEIPPDAHVGHTISAWWITDALRERIVRRD